MMKNSNFKTSAAPKYFAIIAVSVIFGNFLGLNGAFAQTSNSMAVPVTANQPIELAGTSSSLATMTGSIPNFTASPNIISQKSGYWFSPDTWAQGRIPKAQDIVKISQGHTVIYNASSDESLAALGIEGQLEFATDTNTRLKVGTILVYRSGQLHIGTEANPIQPSIKAEIILADRPLAMYAPDPQTKMFDPKQMGTGIISLGEVLIYGAAKTPTWLRLSQEPKAGQTALLLESAPKGWRVGDKLVLPDTRQTPLKYFPSTIPNRPITSQIELVEISNITNNTIILKSPLTFDHLGGRNGKNDIIALPHVGNITRNITVHSENPSGTRGHILFTERARVDIHYASFEDLGRTTPNALDSTVVQDGKLLHIGTNQIGRYSIHFHNVMGPENPTNTGYQFVFDGNCILRSLKWGMSIHNSHFGIVSNNIVYDAQGAGILTEQGNEHEVVIEKNFIVKIGDVLEGLYNPVYGGVAGPGRPLGFGDFGWEGSAFWLSGNDLIVRDNVAANAAFAGVMYNARPSGFARNTPIVPNVRGADISDLSQWTDHTIIPAPEIIESNHNEVYGSAIGVWVSFSGIVGTLKNYSLWNNKQSGLYSTRNASVVFDGFKIINDQQISNQNIQSFGNIYNKGMDFTSSTYPSGAITIKNSHVEGFNVGVVLPGSITPGTPQIYNNIPPVTIVDNAYLQNYVNLIETTPHIPKSTVLKDVTFVQNPGPAMKYVSDTPYAIMSTIESNSVDANITTSSRTFVLNYNHIPGNNFEYFFPEQDPQYVMPQREYPYSSGKYPANANCPTQGLTNQECFKQFGVTMLGRLATCDNTQSHPEVEGFACPLNITDSKSFIDNLLKLKKPSAPTGLMYEDNIHRLSWNIIDDVAGYKIYENNKQIQIAPRATANKVSIRPLPGTITTYGVTSFMEDNSESTPAIIQINTPALDDTTPPSIPSGLNVSDLSTNSLTLNWNASTDSSGIMGYKVFKNGILLGTTSKTTYPLSGLSANTQYSLTVAAFDKFSNLSNQSPILSVLTSPSSKDTMAPSIPSNLTVSNITATSLTLSWDKAGDNVGVVGYKVYDNDKFLGSTSTTTFSISGFDPDLDHKYTVSAFDAAQNESSQSAPNIIPKLDKIKPDIVSDLTSSEITSNSVRLSWTKSEDNVGVAGYEIYKNNSLAGKSTVNGYVVRGLTPKTSYQFSVKAYDFAGNVSDNSQIISITTADGPAPSPTPTPTPNPTPNPAPSKDLITLKNTHINTDSVTFEWLTPAVNEPIEKYTIWKNGSFEGTTSANIFTVDNLYPEVNYAFKIAASNSENSELASLPYFTITTLADPTRMAIPSELIVTNVTTDSISISWEAANLATGYNVIIAGGMSGIVGKTSETTYTVTGLKPNTVYYIAVAAFDGKGNITPKSPSRTARTRQ
ncbi:MAG: fibronectin type III domain-containing protein [Candidatus Omnitrophica bacterium]|nr:fibronectin type III domain-containing protein [Candidatus Omnitrophota bacterium]